MGERWAPWRALRAQGNIEFRLADLPAGVRAICAQRGDDQAILVSSALSPVDRLAALAHELVHIERGGSGHQAGMPERLVTCVQREEERVEDIVARRLVDLEVLDRWVQRRSEVEAITAALAAQEFDVAEHVATRALQMLTNQRRAE